MADDEGGGWVWVGEWTQIQTNLVTFFKSIILRNTKSKPRQKEKLIKVCREKIS